jgi:hypothetical protein
MTVEGGMFAGDDSLVSNLDLKAFEKAAGTMGQVATGSVLPRGAAGVNFLARYYSPEVWFGSPNSCSDIRRQVVKWHTTPSLPPTVTPVDKAIQKSVSYVLTDPETPVLGELCQGVLDLASATENAAFHCKRNDLQAAQRWWDRYEAADQYPNWREDWMEDLLYEQVPDFDYARFRSFMDACTTVQDVLVGMPLCSEPRRTECAEAIVVGEEIRGPDVEYAAVEMGVEEEKESGDDDPLPPVEQTTTLQPPVAASAKNAKRNLRNRERIKRQRERLRVEAAAAQGSEAPPEPVETAPAPPPAALPSVEESAPVAEPKTDPPTKSAPPTEIKPSEGSRAPAVGKKRKPSKKKGEVGVPRAVSTKTRQCPNKRRNGTQRASADREAKRPSGRAEQPSSSTRGSSTTRAART